MPWQRLPDLHRYCGSQSPVCYCYTKPPCCRVAPASTKNHEYESQKDRGACLSRLSTLSLGGMPVFPGRQLIYTCPLPNALKHHKGEELCLPLHVQHSFRLDYDTRYSPPAITREQCEYYLPFRAGAGGGLAPPEGPSLLSCTRPGREVKPANLPVWRLGSGPLHATRKPTRELNPADGQSGDPSWALCPPLLFSPRGMGWIGYSSASTNSPSFREYQVSGFRVSPSTIAALT